jgi:hypothetical protein
MKTAFRNEFNGHRRKVGGFTAFLGVFFFGPLYFAYKGAWPAFIITTLVNIVAIWALFGIPVWAMLINAFIVAPFAATIVRRHYVAQGFTRETSALAA